MMAQDISLLFGVLGEGSLSGESGRLIQSQLTQIMAELNKNTLKVKIGIDTSSGGGKSWSGQIQEKLNQISQSGNFSIQISNIKLSAGAVSDFKKQLGAIMGTFGHSTGTEFTVSATGISEVKKGLQDAGAAATDAASKIAEFKVQMEALSGQKSSVKKSIDDLAKTATTDDERARIAELTAQYEQWAVKIEQVRASKSAATGEYRAQIEAEGAAIRANIESINRERKATEEAAREATARYNLYKQINATLMQVQDAQKNWTAAANGKTRSDYAALNGYVRDLEDLRNTYNKFTQAQAKQSLSRIASDFKNTSEAIRAAGENTKTLGQRMGGLAQKFSAWLSVSQVVMFGVRAIRQMVTATIELDSAMTQLKIVTGSSDSEMTNFLTNATGLAKELGRSITDVLSSIETFSRLGYNIADASKLAEYASILANVASVDVNEATTGMTSIIKGYNMDVSNAEHVADVLVEVGQKYAVSASEMMEAYEKSGAALNAANTSFEKSAGLIAAANASVQNASTVGTALKTVSARIRGSEAELKELGEDTTDLIDGFSKYAGELKALTGFDIMVNDSTFKDIYDIFEGISQVWEDLSDTQQAKVADILGGTRQLQVISSILSNWKDAAGAYADAMDSAGVSAEANATYMESIEGRIGEFKATFQELSNNLIGSDFAKGVVDFGTNMLKVLNIVAKFVDAIGGLSAILIELSGIFVAINLTSIASTFTKIGGSVSSFIAKLLELGPAIKIAKAEGKGLSAALDLVGFSASGAQIAIVAITTAITAAVVAYNHWRQNLEQQRQQNIEAAQAAAEEAENIMNLYSAYQTANEAYAANTGSKEGLESATSELLSTLGYEESEIDVLIKKYGSLDEAINNVTFDSLVDAADKARTGFNAAYDNLQDSFGNGSDFGESIKKRFGFGKGNNLLSWAEETEKLNSKISQILINANLVSEGSTGPIGGTMFIDTDSVDGIIESYDKLIQARELLQKDLSTDEYNDSAAVDMIEGKISDFESILSDYLDARDLLNESVAKNQLFSVLSQNGIPETADEINALKEELISAAQSSNQFAGSGDDIAAAFNKAFDEISKAIPDFTNAVNKSADAGSGLSTYAAQLEELPDALAALKTSYSALASAQNDMSSGKGLSADTIKALAGAEKNYLDYLYEENGVVKLNTDAWKENANAKVQKNTGELQKEIASLDAQRDALDANCDAIRKRNEALEAAMSAIEYYNEVQQEIADNNIDISKSVFGNIDLNNRQVIEWTDEMVSKYQSVIESWGSTTDEFLGTISTVLGSWDEFEGIPIAFSPMLQTENGAELLSVDTVYEYIYRLIDKAGSNLSPEILLKLDAEGLEIDGTQIKNLIADIGKTAESTSSSMHFLGTDGAVKSSARELAAAADEMDMSVEQLLSSYDAFNQEMEDNDLLLEGEEAKVNALTASIEEQQNKLALWSAAIANVTKEVGSLSGSLSELDAVTKQVKSVADVFNEFSEEGKISISTLAGLSDELKGLDSFDHFVDVLTDSASSMKDVQAACNGLAQEYINTSGILDDLNESNANLIEATLEEIGVINAHEIVQARLSATQLQGVLAANGLTDATWDEVEAFLKQTGAADNAIIAIRNLKLEEYNARVAALDFTSATDSNIEALIKQANAAGVAASRISALSSALSLKQSIEGKSSKTPTFFELNHSDELLSGYQKQAQLTAEDFTFELPEVNISSISGGGGGSSGGGGGSSKKEVEEYIAEIDDYRDAIERLNRIQLNKNNLDLKMSNTGDLREQILLRKDLINTYRDEQNALHELNELRDQTITDNSEKLRNLGFEVEYDRDNNLFFVENMEHLNDLVADGKGKYDSVQEATNALRKETEELINSMDSLNKENQEGSTSWLTLRNSIRDAKNDIINDLKQIVSDASDAVDEIQNVSDVLHTAADEYADNGGFISVETYQKIIELGPQYMQMLMDENGLLVINEERINEVTAAKTRQLAAEQALTYVERLRLALQEGSVENLNTLLYATTEATDATFGLAYAELALMHSLGDLDDQQYAAALHNIEAIESLANTTISGIGKVAGAAKEERERALKEQKEELEDMKSGLDDILKYVMDMLKHRIQQQIDALEELKDAYADIIDLRKEALDAAKKEADYEDKVADKVKQIAKLQERINALSLDNSRDAKAQKIKLEEEMAELQKELSDDQADYAVDAQKDALDDMQEAYENEKDAEIAALEETISSYQKLYDMAIDYIESHWNTLYDELIAWNTEYGSVLNSEITEAWNNCLAAAQRYGSYVSALNSIDSDIDSISNSISNKDSGDSGSKNNTVVGNKTEHSTSSQEDNIHAIIKQMYNNGQKWAVSSANERQELDRRNLSLGSQLAKYGIHTTRKSDGVWYIDGTNERLFDKYRKYTYHGGGIAGDNPTLKQNEIMAILEKGEAILDKRKEHGLYRLVEFATTLSDKFSELVRSSGLFSSLTGSDRVVDVKPDAIPNVTNSEKISIEFGDTIVYGANKDTVEQHRAITRQQANELLDKLNIKR